MHAQRRRLHVAQAELKRGDVHARAVVGLRRRVVVLRSFVHAPHVGHDGGRSVGVGRGKRGVHQQTPLSRLEVPCVAQIVHRDFFTREVVVPRAGVREPGHDVHGNDVEVAHEDRVLVWRVQVDALALAAAVHIEVVRAKHRLRLLQMVERRDGLGQAHPVFILQIFPRCGLLVELAPFLKRAVQAIEDADLVPEFTPVPHHLGPGNGQQKGVHHFQTVHGCGLLLGVVIAGGVAVRRQTERRALLVVAFGVRDQVGPIPTSVLPRAVIDVAVVAHGRFGVLLGHLAPKHESAVGEHCFFVVVAEVFQDHVRPWVVVPNVVAVIEQDVHPALVVLGPIPHVAA